MKDYEYVQKLGAELLQIKQVLFTLNVAANRYTRAESAMGLYKIRSATNPNREIPNPQTPQLAPSNKKWTPRLEIKSHHSVTNSQTASTSSNSSPIPKYKENPQIEQLKTANDELRDKMVCRLEKPSSSLLDLRIWRQKNPRQRWSPICTNSGRS